jgi:hypothetical protein
MLAYGLNKNLKKLRERPKSAKPVKRGKKKRGQGRKGRKIEFNEGVRRDSNGDGDGEDYDEVQEEDDDEYE